jgi:hypothetical protein
MTSLSDCSVETQAIRAKNSTKKKGGIQSSWSSNSRLSVVSINASMTGVVDREENCITS